MKIAVFGKRFESEFDHAVRTLLCDLNGRSHELVVYSGFREFLENRKVLPETHLTSFSTHIDAASCDLFISIGGDGTLLDSVSFVRDSGVPILGINTGRLGFLSNVSSDEIKEAVDAIDHKNYTLDKRTLIHVQCEIIPPDAFAFALNEVTVYKHSEASMVTVHAFMNDRLINTYWADGLIVATPTGSTAYSLSCGGPIMTPGSEAFVLTPIAPHNLNVRPLVLPNKSELILRAEGRTNTHKLTLDSRPFELPTGVDVRLKTADFKIHLLNLEGQHFFQTIRNKMMWGLDKRN